MQGKIALFGAAGAISKSIAEAPRSRNTGYRVVGRDRQRLVDEIGQDRLAEIVTWDPQDPASVRAAARRIDTIIYLVCVPCDRSELHPDLMRKTLAGATAEGVKRMVLIGTVYSYGKPVTQTVSESHPRNPHEFVFVPDVGPVVLDFAEKPESYGRWWNFAGAGSITQKEIAHEAFRLAGRTPKLRVAGKTLLRLIGIFKPFMRELVEMHYLVTTPVLMDDRARSSTSSAQFTKPRTPKASDSLTKPMQALRQELS